MSKKELPPSKVSKSEEDWMTKKWRPMMAIMYMTACLFDFVFFPIMFTIVQFWETAVQNDAFRQWVPITLQGGGLFHVAMGAVLGVSAWSRGQEKMAGAAGGSNALQPVSQSVTTTFGQTSPNLSQPGGSYNSPGTNSWGTTPVMGNGGGYQPGYGATPPQGNSFGSPGQVTTGWGGKKSPPEPEYPVLG